MVGGKKDKIKKEIKLYGKQGRKNGVVMGRGS